MAKKPATKAAAVEELPLVLRGGAAERLIAVREAAVAPDDVGMLLRILEELVVAQVARQLDAMLLVGQMLRVHER